MFKTNYTEIENEFLEEIDEFCPKDKVDVEIYVRENGNKLFVNGEVNDYAFSDEYEIISNSELEYKRYKKRYAKLSLYKAMKKILNVVLPWGALTGIRPVKFAYGCGDNFKDYFKNVMDVSSEKTEMVSKIIDAQKPYYEIDGNNVDFFVGIPFCPTKCKYCSFISSAITKDSLIKEYTDALVKEIEYSKRFIGKLRSVYIGGGTPVALPNAELEKILKAIGIFDVEYTVEAGRPDCINEDNLRLLKDYGVNRICVNPQTFNDKTLEIIGRKHTSKDILEKYELAEKFGFSINMDLIAGLTGESLQDFKYSLDTTVKLNPDNVTVHTLSLKKGAKLKEETERLDEGAVPEMISYAYNELTKNGYNPYYLYRQKYMAGNLENAGYSKKGKECIYNIDTMEEIASNVACGTNSVSKRLFEKENRIERYGAPKDVKTYIDKIDIICNEKSKLFV